MGELKGKRNRRIAAPGLTVGRLLSYLQRITKSDPRRLGQFVWLSTVPDISQWDKAKHVWLHGADGGVTIVSDTVEDIKKYTGRGSEGTEVP